MRKILVFIATTILLSACGVKGPTDEQLAAADYGSVPKKDYKKLVMEYVNWHYPFLVDYPETVEYARWTDLYKGWVQDSFPDITYYGYRGCVYINAKKYTKHGNDVYYGLRPYIYVIKNDEVVFMTGGSEIGSVYEQDLLKQCDPLYDADFDALRKRAYDVLQKELGTREQRVNSKPLPVKNGD